MHTILYNHQISAALCDLVAESRKQLLIVSPYIDIWPHFEQQLKSALKRGVEITIVFRRSEAEKYADCWKSWLAWGIDVRHAENLHTKLYMNDDTVIMGSMNLYEFSQRNSEELVLRTSDPVLYRHCKDYYTVQLKTRTRTVLGQAAAAAGKSLLKGLAKVGRAIAEQVFTEESGVCIRCAKKIDQDPAKPYCTSCFASWRKYENPDYAEKYCHICGKKAKTSLAKPVCYDCFKAGH